MNTLRCVYSSESMKLCVACLVSAQANETNKPTQKKVDIVQESEGDARTFQEQ